MQALSDKSFSRLFIVSPWVIWGLGAAFFFCEYFARVAPGVMVSELMQDLNVTAFGLGSLSAFFYYAYISMQLPVGMLVDRYGPHKLLTMMCFVCGLGTFLFSKADSIYLADLGRFLTGFSAAFAFVGALKLASVWFPASRFGLLAGLTQALGMLGACVGEAPTAYLVHVNGWRNTLEVFTIVFIILAVLIGSFVRDFPTDYPKTQIRQLQSTGLFKSLLIVLKNPASWINGFYAGMIYAPTAAFGELWGVSYISQAHHVSTEVAAGAIGAIFIGWGIGGPLFGFISDYIQRRKPLMYASAIIGLALIVTVVYVPGLDVKLVYAIMFCYGLTNAGLVASYATSAEINPKSIAGTSMAFCNMASIMVGALFQPVIGKVLDYLWNGTMVNGIRYYSVHDYQVAFLVLPCFMLLSLVAAFFIKETYCKAKE